MSPADAGLGQAPAAGSTSAAPDAGHLPEHLARDTYRTYRRRQAMALIRLLPSDAVRALYGRAREWAANQGVERGKDPLAVLRRYCEHLLPLPPFRVWLADLSANPDAHVDELDPPAPEAGPEEDLSPVAVELRTLDHGGDTWYATLNLVPAGPDWRGFISFHRDHDAGSHRTADVFREESARAVRRRFRSFDDAALGAFLRSVLP